MPFKDAFQQFPILETARLLLTDLCPEDEVWDDTALMAILKRDVITNLSAEIAEDALSYLQP